MIVVGLLAALSAVSKSPKGDVHRQRDRLLRD
jgi:hypothetical protein